MPEQKNRFLEELRFRHKVFAGNINDSRLKLDEGAALVNRVIGRLLGRTTRASRLYEIDYDPETRHLDWRRKENQWDNSRELHGCYHLLRWTEYTLALSGCESTWRTLRRRLETHRYSTLIVPTAKGVEHHIRKAGRPSEQQKMVYAQLGIDWKSLPPCFRGLSDYFFGHTLSLSLPDPGFSNGPAAGLVAFLFFPE